MDSDMACISSHHADVTGAAGLFFLFLLLFFRPIVRVAKLYGLSWVFFKVLQDNECLFVRIKVEK